MAVRQKFVCLLSWCVITATYVTANNVDISPNPTVTAKVDSSVTVQCTTTYTWRSISFYDETRGFSSSPIILVNSSGTCFPAGAVTPGYRYTCDINRNLYGFTVDTVTTEHNGKILRCTVQYGPSSTNDIASADTTIIFGPSVTTMDVTTVVTEQSSSSSQSLFTTYQFRSKEQTTTPTDQPTIRSHSPSISQFQSLQPYSTTDPTDINFNPSNSFETTSVSKQYISNESHQLSDTDMTIIIIICTLSAFAIIIVVVFLFIYDCKKKHLYKDHVNKNRNAIVKQRRLKMTNIGVRNAGYREPLRNTTSLPSSYLPPDEFTFYNGNISGKKTPNFNMCRKLQTGKYWYDENVRPYCFEESACDSHFDLYRQQHLSNNEYVYNYVNQKFGYPDQMKTQTGVHYQDLYRKKTYEHLHPDQFYYGYGRLYHAEHNTSNRYYSPKQDYTNYQFYKG